MAQVPGPILRGEVVAGPNTGSVAFGSAHDWFRAHGAAFSVADAISRAIEGKPGTTITDAKGAIWVLKLHRLQPARPARPAQPVPLVQRAA